METPNEILAFDLARAGCEYYKTARFAHDAACWSVFGNLFHHAIEMMLKGGLAKRGKSSDDLKAMRHNLKKLWRCYKEEFPDSTLGRHDKTIS